jgi:hypothetical protein
LVAGIFYVVLPAMGFFKHRVNKKLNKIIMNQQELEAALIAIKDQNDKARAEILAKFTSLEAAITAAGNTTPEVDAAVLALKASVQTDDDIVPDAPSIE